MPYTPVTSDGTSHFSMGILGDPPEGGPEEGTARVPDSNQRPRKGNIVSWSGSGILQDNRER